ncbi:helix-turn-helix domain-containing protein [Stella sp.]|uniref:helix-turn-helix domain-containing protein n=1 Tax=Stella sp. TaxID=2912054 RepID=UPI0035B31AAA
MDRTPTDVDARLARRLRTLRAERALTLEELAGRSGVSRSMISLIERGESSPTAAVLDRLATGLGLSLAALFAESERPDADPVARRADQPLWRDPETGYQRRHLSPLGYPTPLELVEVEFPAGARVAYESAPRGLGIRQQIWIIDGEMELTVGDAVHRLAAGDCLAMAVDRPIAFRNPGGRPARYLVALTVRRS